MLYLHWKFTEVVKMQGYNEIAQLIGKRFVEYTNKYTIDLQKEQGYVNLYDDAVAYSEILLGKGVIRRKIVNHLKSWLHKVRKGEQ